jgi:hypothetical protein
MARFRRCEPRIHDGDPSGDFRGDTNVVGHEDYRKPEFALKFAQQQQDLDLHRGVERRSWLVGEQHLGPAGERQRDHGALAHATRHLVRIVVEALRR